MDKSAVEEALAKHFIRYLTREDLSPVCKPDAPGHPTRRGGHPDYVFKDSSGHQYVLELTRLLAPRSLRELHQFAIKNVCAPLKGRLPGTYLLRIDLDQLTYGKLSPVIAQQTVNEILALIQNGVLRDKQSLSTGFALDKVGGGSRIEPWVTAQELPFDLTVGNPLAKELQAEFENIVAETDSKFLGYTGERILLIDISQSGLDWEYHAQTFKDAKGVILLWAEQLEAETNVDSIYICQMRVWQAGTMHRVLAGHKYIDQPPPHYWKIWPRL